MTRRDYEALAKVVREHAPGAYAVRGDIMLGSIANALADALEADSDRFDRDRFLTACELERATEPV